MTATDQLPARARLDADLTKTLATLPAMGKLMVTSSHAGATHERIGTVESVVSDGDWVVLAGAEHDSRIEAGAIAGMIVDRSGRMGDKVYPRIDFQAADGGNIFSVVGFEGLEPFDKELAGLGALLPLEPAEKPVAGERGEVAADDPGAVPFEAALASEAETVIGFRRAGFEQRWRGRVEAVKPAMGFINVMRPDFHLHLKAGSVARWRGDGPELHAEAADGAPLGLFVVAGN